MENATTKFLFEERPSDSPYVDSIWRTRSTGGGAFMSVAESHCGIVVTKYQGKTTLTVRGPETKATPAPIPEDAEFIGIVFKLGSYMPPMPARSLVDNPINLPEDTDHFWLDGLRWEFPNFENADTFINRLVREGYLAHEPLVSAALQGEVKELSLRSVQRRFLQTTGLTHSTIRQIERARQAMALLQQGMPILDTVYEAGYFDQPHLTRSLKHLVGQTPSEIIGVGKVVE